MAHTGRRSGAHTAIKAAIFGLVAAAGAGGRALARAPAGDQFAELSRLSLEELANIEVTSVSRRPEPISQAPAAVHVITNEDVRRSGVTSLPEALRLAPNLQVSRIDALDYAISARGFNGFESANKLLVLIDGRSVYTPLYSGVEWDAQHVVLDDLERIEVISGPGGVLWGANAVNGVVNITTRDARETLGPLLSVTAGTVDSAANLRFGFGLGETGAMRLYAAGYRRGTMLQASGRKAQDGWDGVQLGFRGDWGMFGDALTLQGDAYDNALGRSAGLTGGYVRGGNLLGRWQRRLDGEASLSVQAYYDRAERRARGIFNSLETWDLQAQHGLAAGARHQIVWGGGYRMIDDAFRNFINPFTLDPPSRRVGLGNLYLQDTVALTDELDLVLGVKVEHSSFTGLDYMPNVRLAWRPTANTFFWGAISRVVRTPSRLERELIFPGVVVGGRFQPETLIAYQAGYRGRPSPASSLSISLFFNDYDDLRTNERSPGGRLPVFVGNEMRGQTYGIEAWGDHDVASWWRLSAGFTALHKHFELKPGSLDVSRLEAAGVDPDFQASLRSQMDLGERVELDIRLRYLDDIPKPAAGGYVGASDYLEADARLAWRVTPGVELSFGGFNLLDKAQPEASETRRRQIRRGAYAGLKWSY